MADVQFLDGALQQVRDVILNLLGSKRKRSCDRVNGGDPADNGEGKKSVSVSRSAA